MAFSINFPSAEVRIFRCRSHTCVLFLIRWCSASRAGGFCSRFHPSAFSPTRICQTVRTCLWAICLSSFAPTAHQSCVFKAQSEAAFLSLKRFLRPSVPALVLRPFLSFPILHLASKPSWISVCIRAVSSTNLASTFSCSTNGFRAVGCEETRGHNVTHHLSTLPAPQR